MRCNKNTVNQNVESGIGFIFYSIMRVYHPKKTIPIPHMAIDNPEIGVMYFSSHSVFIKLKPK